MPRTMPVTGRIATAAVALVGLLGLVGCAQRERESPPAMPPNVLPTAAEHVWRLVRLVDDDGSRTSTAWTTTSTPTLDLREFGTISGWDGCRDYRGRTDVTAGHRVGSTAELRIADLSTDPAGCGGGDPSARFRADLLAVRTLVVDGDRLRLRGGDTVLTFTSDDAAASATPTPSASTALPSAAARLWSVPADPQLRLDLRTPDRIVVDAGCLGFEGDLAVSPPPDDPTSGVTAGPTVAVAVAPDEPAGARCLAIVAGQREFADAVRQATSLSVVDDRLYLSGPQTALELTAAD